MGYVRIRAAPNTFVSFQGKRLGKTPMKPVALPAGQVQLHVRNRQMGISKSYKLNIEPGKEVVLHVRRPKAKAPSP
jgi:serine/threonine-protein kinase